MVNEPTRSRPRFPTEYGAPRTTEGLLSLEWLYERLGSARNYWLSSITPGGRPHARPVDGVWVEGALSCGGGPATRWVRNLHANPAVTVTLGGEDEADILEGDAEWIVDPDHPLAVASTHAAREKYPYYFGAEPLPHRPFFAVRPHVAYGWTLDTFPASTTRWVWS
jgi:hypothetical protein